MDLINFFILVFIATNTVFYIPKRLNEIEKQIKKLEDRETK